MEKKEFGYAHNDTSQPERASRTQGLNKPRFSARVQALRQSAHEREIPTASEETLNFVLTLAEGLNAHSVLEVGCAEGITSLALAERLDGARITAIEKDENFAAAFNKNLAPFAEACQLLVGDALEICPQLPAESFDFIFLDCAKVQYIKLLPHLKRALKKGGALLADDVLLYGWVNGETPAPKKRHALINHVREYIEAVTDDGELSTAILDVGNGLAFSVKRA